MVYQVRCTHFEGETKESGPIPRSALEKDPRPGPLLEGNPVGEGTTRRGPVAIRRGEGAQRKRCRDPRCSPRGTPACRGTFGGRRKAVRDRLALQGGTGDPFVLCLPPQGCLPRGVRASGPSQGRTGESGAHLVMSMCTVFSGVVGRGCLL